MSLFLLFLHRYRTIAVKMIRILHIALFAIWAMSVPRFRAGAAESADSGVKRRPPPDQNIIVQVPFESDRSRVGIGRDSNATRGRISSGYRRHRGVR